MATLLYKLPSQIRESHKRAGEVKVGDYFKFIPDQTKNAEWPSAVKLQLVQIVSDKAEIAAMNFVGVPRVYCFEIDTTPFEVGTGQQQPDGCSFTEVMLPWECCDDLQPTIDDLLARVAQLEATVIVEPPA